jgi:hypothetical protein
METPPRIAPSSDQDTETDNDASDVVEGPIGSAHLVEPTEAEAGSLGADLDALPAIDDTETSAD